MRHKDARIRLMAASIMLKRGYGKPEQNSDGTVVHKFAIAPRSWRRRSGWSVGGSRDGTSVSRPQLTIRRRFA
jgi:hypothetical protein